MLTDTPSKIRHLCLLRKVIVVLILLSIYDLSYSQTVQDNVEISRKTLDQIEKKIDYLNNSLEKKSVALITQTSRQESKIKSKLSKIDSVTSSQIFTLPETKIDAAKKNFSNKSKALKENLPLEYLPGLDSLSSTFKFLNSDAELLKKLDPNTFPQIKEIKEKLSLLQGKMNAADELKKTINERRLFLQDRLNSFGFKKDLDKITKKLIDYKACLSEYKNILNDRDKLQQKLLEGLSQIPAFRKFLQQNSFLSGLFSTPTDPSSLQNNLQGLQTRNIVNQVLQQRLSANGSSNPSQFLQQQAAAAKEQINNLKNRLNSLSGGSDDIQMPNYKPNTQKRKSFLKRLEYGGNVQFGKTTTYIPSTSDIAFNVGYKINDKSVFGIAASYKAGLGNGLSDIRISHQGIGFRSYLDWKIKKNYFISGGYEKNHFSQFQSVRQLVEVADWQSSALLGISKRYKISKKIKGNIQILYDFLYREHHPISQPFVYRIGYIFK